MGTVTQKRSRVKPARFIRLELAPFEGNPGIVKITVGKEVTDYMLYPLASDFGSAYRLVKLGPDAGEEYHVNLNGPTSSCECKGQLRWGHLHPCKHIAGLQRLVEVGQVPARQSAPQKVA